MKIRYHWELDVYNLAREGRRRIFAKDLRFFRDDCEGQSKKLSSGFFKIVENRDKDRLTF